MDSPCIKQTVCKVLNIFQCGKYLVAYVLKAIIVHLAKIDYINKKAASSVEPYSRGTKVAYSTKTHMLMSLAV